MTRQDIFSTIEKNLTRIAGTQITLQMVNDNHSFICSFDGQNENAVARLAGYGKVSQADYDSLLDFTMIEMSL